MSAWKACDIRGPFPDEVSPDMFRQIGGAVSGMVAPAGRILVAGDFRLSTPELKSALIEGLSSRIVLDAGRIPTPVAYFAYRQYAADAVLIVTASHNPPNHNGLKLMIGPLPPAPADLETLRERHGAIQTQYGKGRVYRVDPAPAYRNWILGRWAGAHGLRVVLDAGNGAWSRLGPEIFEALGYDVVRLYCSIDGSYPNRPPDSAQPRNLWALRNLVRQSRADLGIAWDGDGDRVTFADETGTLLEADEMAVLLARHLLLPGDRLVYDIKLSDVVRSAAAKCGATPLMERSGHAFIKRRMIQEDCAFGCEASGHYFFRELGGGDDGLFTALMVCGMAAGQPLGVLRKSVPPIFATSDLRLRGAQVSFEQIAGRMRDALPDARTTTLDGLRLETAEGFILVRESVTEPAVTLRIEGFDSDAFERLQATAVKAVPELARQLQERS